MRRLSFVSLIVNGLVCLAQAHAEPLKLKATIPHPGVEGRFDHFDLDPKTRRLFVAALGNNTVELIDVASGKRAQTIAGLRKPQGVLFLPALERLCVACGEDGTLRIFDAFSLQQIQSIGSVNDADNVRLDPRTGLVYVGYGDGALAIIDPKKGQTIADIELAGHPESFQLERSGIRIFVNVPDRKQIAVIDREKRTVGATWSAEKFQANFPMALDEANHRLFIGCRKPPRLVVYDTEAGKTVADYPISGDTDDLFFDPKRKRVYVICGEGFVDTLEQISPDHYKALAKALSAPGARTGFFSPDQGTLFVAVPHRGDQQAEIRVFECE